VPQVLNITAPLVVLDQPSHLSITAAAAAVPQVLNITAPLVVLDQPSRTGYGGIKLCLLDTPGPNEAGEEGLKYQVGWGLGFCK
jgi:hypothetical protein